MGAQAIVEENIIEGIATLDECLACLRAEARCVRHTREVLLHANAALSLTDKTSNAA